MGSFCWLKGEAAVPLREMPVPFACRGEDGHFFRLILLGMGFIFHHQHAILFAHHVDDRALGRDLLRGAGFIVDRVQGGVLRQLGGKGGIIDLRQRVFGDPARRRAAEIFNAKIADR